MPGLSTQAPAPASAGSRRRGREVLPFGDDAVLVSDGLRVLLGQGAADRGRSPARLHGAGELDALCELARRLEGRFGRDGLEHLLLFSQELLGGCLLRGRGAGLGRCDEEGFLLLGLGLLRGRRRSGGCCRFRSCCRRRFGLLLSIVVVASSSSSLLAASLEQCPRSSEPLEPARVLELAALLDGDVLLLAVEEFEFDFVFRERGGVEEVEFSFFLSFDFLSRVNLVLLFLLLPSPQTHSSPSSSSAAARLRSSASSSSSSARR